MASNNLSTSEFAKQFGVHPNTIRLYEVWGYLPPIPRDEHGYRMFGQQHVAQMELARVSLKMPAAGAQIKDSLKALVWLASSGDYYLAQTHAQKHLRMIEVAQAQCKLAIAFTKQDRGESLNLFPQLALPLTVRGAAELMGISVPVLRRWEQYGLIHVPQNSSNHYREYGSNELGWLHLIQTLRLIGYTVEACLQVMGQPDKLLEALQSSQKILARHKKHILKVRQCLDQMTAAGPEF